MYFYLKLFASSRFSLYICNRNWRDGRVVDRGGLENR